MRAFVLEIATRLGLELTAWHFEESIALVERLLNEVFADPAGAFQRPLDRYVPTFKYPARAAQLRHELELARLEISRLKSALSWRMTKPVRFIWNLLTGRLFEMPPVW
ncbi:MAG: hypothetical protein AABY95_10095 [Pseudomonadota bacterium]